MSKPFGTAAKINKKSLNQIIVLIELSMWVDVHRYKSRDVYYVSH